MNETKTITVKGWKLIVTGFGLFIGGMALGYDKARCKFIELMSEIALDEAIEKEEVEE